MKHTAPVISRDISSISTAGALYAFMLGLVEETAQRYEYISTEQAAHQNDEVAALFRELADMEHKRIDEIKAQARQFLEKNEALQPQDTHLPVESDRRAGLVRESAGNPYLLTPYRALQLAVTDKLWVFEYLSTIDSVIEDEIICEKIEELALEELELIAQLRKKRRIAYRQEEIAEIPGHHSNEGLTATSPDSFAAFADDANTVICAMANHIEHTWTDHLSEKTAEMIVTLRSRLCHQTDCAALLSTAAGHHKQRDTDLFSALRILLRELEAACDMSLDIAESSQDEEVVEKAQGTAKIYVELLALVRDEIVSIEK